MRYLTEQYLTTHKVFVSGMDIRDLTRLYRDMAGYSILEDPLADLASDHRQQP